MQNKLTACQGSARNGAQVGGGRPSPSSPFCVGRHIWAQGSDDFSLRKVKERCLLKQDRSVVALVNCPREMPFLGLLFTLLIPLDSQIHFVFRAKRKIWKIMCTKNKIKYLTVLPLKIILWRSQAYFVFYLFFFHMSQKIFLGLPWRSSDGRLCFQSRWPRFDPWSGN